MRVYDFLFTVAEQLGDGKTKAPFRRYPLAMLTTFYNEALTAVGTYRPDLVTDFLTMKLAPGINQDARCCGCLNITGLSAQIDAQGRIIADLSALGITSSTSPTAEKNRWFRAPCRVTDDGDTIDYTVKNWTIVAGMNGVFTVYPPVPADVDVWVQVKCKHAMPTYTEAQVLGGLVTVLDQYLPAIRSYVLYRAQQGDVLAVGATTAAQNELKNFFAFLEVEYKMEKQQEAE